MRESGAAVVGQRAQVRVDALAFVPTSGPGVNPVAPSALPISTAEGDVKAPATSGRSEAALSVLAATIERVSRTVPDTASRPPASPPPFPSESAQFR